MEPNVNYTASDYLAAFRRRRRVFGYVGFPIVVCAGLLAAILPAKYTSSAQIEINLEGSSVRTLQPIEVSTYADQYVARLQSRVLARDNLLALANNSRIFAESDTNLSDSERIEKIQESVRISMLTQPVLSPNSGRMVDLISGIQVAAVATEPEFSHRVASNIAKRFLEEDRVSRTARAGSTHVFLIEQLKVSEQEIRNLEKEVADFKVVNACCLPELVGLNTSVVQRAERDLERMQPRIRTLEKDRVFLKRQLDEIGQFDGASERLDELEQEYMSLVANYGPDHPDVNRLRREIIALTSAESNSGDTIEIIELKIKLAEAEQRYSQDHPDVIRYRQELANLESVRGVTGRNSRNEMLNNPRYIQLRSEFNAINTELSVLRRNQPALRQKIEEYEIRLARTPQVESEFQAIDRRLQSAGANFEDLQRRAVDAQQSEALESTDIGARLVQIVAASLPKSPSGPPRMVILVLGLFLAATLGVGSMLFAEMTDGTVRGRKDVIIAMNMVPLAAIPVIENSNMKKQRQRQNFAIKLSLLVLTAVIVGFYFTSVS